MSQGIQVPLYLFKSVCVCVWGVCAFIVYDESYVVCYSSTITVIAEVEECAVGRREACGQTRTAGTDSKTGEVIQKVG